MPVKVAMNKTAEFPAHIELLIRCVIVSLKTFQRR